MELVVIVTVLALIQFTVFGIQAASARGKAGIKAPTMTGEAACDRSRRVHQNTMEQLLMFLPLMWLFAFYVKPLWAAGFGVIFLIARLIYRAAYLKDPTNRTIGFSMTFMPSAIMAVWLLIDAVLKLV